MIRAVLIFLVAVGLGALTVSGQDGGKEADLKRRIRALTEELRNRADAQAPKGQAPARVALRIYDIGDLSMRFTSVQGRDVNLYPSKYQRPERAEVSEPKSPFEVDWMIEVIRQLIEPATWDTLEYADIQPKDGRLFINTIPRVHKKIGALLDTLRTMADRQLRIELFAVPVDEADAALWGARTRELTNEEADRLLERKSMGSVEFVCRSAQTLAQRVGRTVHYMQDYDVEIAQEATIGDPIHRDAFSGMAVEVRPMLDDGGHGVRLDIRLDRTEIRDPIRRADTEHGPLELPEMALTKLRTSVWFPLDRVVILGGATAGDSPCLFLGRVTRMGKKLRR